MVSPRGVLLKNESMCKLPMKLLDSCSTISMCKLPMKLLDSCSTISVAKLNKPLSVYFFVVNGSKIGTKYFARLYVGVCKASKDGLKGEQPLTLFYAFYKNHILFQFYNLGHNI